MMSLDKGLTPAFNLGNNDELEDDTSKESPDPVSQAMNNVVIIETISKFMDVSDLMQARQVNKVWNHGTLPSVREKFVVFLKMGGPYDKSKLQAFVEETNKLQPLRSCKIEISTKSPHPSFSINDKEMYTDLQQMWSMSIWPESLSINFRKGHYAAACEAELKAFNDILQHLSPSLEILEIGQEADGNIHPHHYRVSFPVRNDIQFPNLTKLILRHRYFWGKNHGYLWANKIYEMGYSSLFASAPNLQELRFERFGLFIGTFLDTLLNLEDKSRNWALLPKLTALSDFNIGYQQSYQYLTAFPQTFTRLDLTNVRPELFTEFGYFLEKNKNSLVSLKMWEFAGKHEIYSQSDTLKIPDCFPKLEKLEIAFRDLEFDLKFEGGTLNYSKNFPALKKLSIDFIGQPNSKQTHKLKNLFDTFFPEQVFEKLRVLETDFETLYSKYLEGVGGDEFWHFQMFPNARIKSLKFSASFRNQMEAFEGVGSCAVDISKLFPQRRFLD